jgi:lycopene cyclase CruA
MTAVLTKPPAAAPIVLPKTSLRSALDLAEFRRRAPLTVARFASLPQREAWLRRIWELETNWQEAMERQQKAGQTPEVIVRAAPPATAEIEETFDIIYAGGVLGLLYAAAAAASHTHKRRVLVFDSHTIGRTHSDWNISDEELSEFTRAGLFTNEEIERTVMNRYRACFVKFHDAGSRIKAPPLWMSGVRDVAVSADDLLNLAAAKIRASEGCAIVDNLRFVRCYVEPHRVTIEAEEARTDFHNGDNRAPHRFFSARLFVDASGKNSKVARQLNDERTLTHVCPTVGTVARGFVRSEGKDDAPDKVDFGVGEILVSTEDASENRQLIWEGFAGNPARDEYRTGLFFYDTIASRSDKSLLSLFERYFEKLPDYKRAGAGWKVVKPVFGYAPSFHRQGWRSRERTATDRVLTLGNPGGLSSPFTFCGFGSHVKNLRLITEQTNRALDEDSLDARALGEINVSESRAGQMASLAEFMRPVEENYPGAVNETLNAVTAALHGLNEDVRRELFQDRISSIALKQLLTRTGKIYPRIFTRLRERLGTRGTLLWFAGIAEIIWRERRIQSNE